MTPPLCIVVKGFPRLSETFITRELEALQDAGLRFSLASLRSPQADAQKVSHHVSAPVNYLPEYLHDEPMRVWRSIRLARNSAGFGRAWRLFRADLARDLRRNRVRRFGQACVLAAELPPDTRHLHAHFIHTPASVARYAAAIRDVSFSVSAHAKDIWTTPEWDLNEKVQKAAFVCACNAAGADRLSGVAPRRSVFLWPHLTTAITESARRERGSRPIRVLTVARAVPKKGLTLTMEALARLPPAPAWTWTHIGGGPDLPALKASAQSHPYRDRLTFLGARPHADVLAALESHDVFLLTARIADDGDRDGRPNAVIEAMSAGLACVATGTGGIPELLTPESGQIVAPDPAAIAASLTTLISAQENIVALGGAARARAAQLHADGLNGFKELERALRMASGQ